MVMPGVRIDVPPRWRVPLLVLGFVSLALGMLGGLWRLGWEVPLPGTQPATFHGALMAAAFFGTVIGLERAVAYARWPAYLAPLFAGAGGIATALGAPHLLAAGLLTAGAVALAAVTFIFWRRQPAFHLLMLVIGALSGVAGNLLWLAGLPTAEVVGAWAGFLIVTIAGERLELSRLRRPSPGALKVLAAATALYLVGAAVLPFHWATGTALAGAGMLGIGAWLLVRDVARHNLGQPGLTRYAAVCLVSGYVWLGIGGLLLPFAPPGGPVYDAALHAVFLGFVFAMVFGHAPIIFPAVLRVGVPYTPLYYAHLVLLDLTLAVRIAGDLADSVSLRAWGGLGNVAALILFVLMTAGSVVRGRR